MIIYYDIEKNCRCDRQGSRIGGYTPVIRYKEKPVWTLRFMKSGTLCSTSDFCGAVAFRAAIDVDLTTSTEVICRTIDSSITHTNMTSGEISVPINANTAGFGAAADGQEQRKAYFELWGLNTNADPVFYVRFEVLISGVVDADGGTEVENLVPDSITRTEVLSILRAADERQFTNNTSDSTTFHSTQNSGDLYTRRRNSAAGGEWGPWETLVAGSNGFSPSASVTQVPNGAIVTITDTRGTTSAAIFHGSDGRIASAYANVTSLTNTTIFGGTQAIQVAHDAAPVAVYTDLSHFYPLERNSVISSGGYWYIDPAPYLAYDGAAAFTGSWTVYFAGGLPEVQTIIDAAAAITPQEHQTFRHTLASGDVLSIVTSSLTATQCMTFEIWLDMPSTVVSFTWPEMTWIEGAAPAATAASTRYVVTVRWNGTKLLANLAYTEALV